MIDDQVRTDRRSDATRGGEVLHLLRDRIDIRKVAFTERGSRLLLLHEEDGLALRLAERQVEQGLPDDRHRLPAALKALQPTDGEGRPMPFSVVTQPDLLTLHTAAGDFHIAFADGQRILIQLPPGGAGIHFTAVGEHHASPVGGFLTGRSPGVLRAVAYAANVPLLRNVTGESGALRGVTLTVAAASTPAISLAVASGVPALPVPDPPAVFAASVARWSAWFAAVPPVSAAFRQSYYYAWWLMAANLVSPRGYLTREGMLPSKVKFIGVWHWDALFHALAYRHVDLDLAAAQLRILLDHQQEDGMLPDVVHDTGLIVRDEFRDGCAVTKPPLMAWAALKLYASGAGRSFLAELYEPLGRWTDWWFTKQNDGDGDGIAQYNHVWSSGLDDSPLWDEGMPVESPDLSSYLCVQMQSLAQIALLLGRRDEALAWQNRAVALARLLVRHFYDPVAGVFWAQREHRPVPVLTPFNLLPLWTGGLDSAQVAATVRHLTAPEAFASPYPLPTVARGHPAFDPQHAWRGPAWINANYILVEALYRAGQIALARRLADQTIALVARHADIAEYYDPETGSVPATAASGFGWSAALFIDLLLRREAERTAMRRS